MRVTTPLAVTSAKRRSDLRLLFSRSATAAKADPAFAFVMPTIMPLFLLIVFTAIYADIANVDGFPTEQFIDWVAPGAVFLPALMGPDSGQPGLSQISIRAARSPPLSQLIKATCGILLSEGDRR